jgi:hypothetical protein
LPLPNVRSISWAMDGNGRKIPGPFLDRDQ